MTWMENEAGESRRSVRAMHVDQAMRSVGCDLFVKYPYHANNKVGAAKDEHNCTNIA